MKFTNKFGFPHYVEEWLTNDEYDYDPDAVTATSLLKPIRMFVLAKRYKDVTELDISDLIASRYGTALHDSLEKVKVKNAIQENRLQTSINGYKVTGKFDMIVDMDKPVKKLVDVKSTSVWSYIFNSKHEDYITQLSIYRFLAQKNNINVGEDAEIFMMFTDWSGTKARSDPSYPQARIAIVPIKLWPPEQTEKFIVNRLRLFDTASILPDNDLPWCNETELWSNNGIAKRCSYCSVKNHCNQYAHLKSIGAIE